MERRLGCSRPAATLGAIASQDARDTARCPGTTEARCGETSGVERPRDHRMRPQPATLEPAHDPAGFLGAAGVEHGPNADRGCRMRPAVPPHQQVQIVRAPPAAPGAKSLLVQGCGEIGIGGDAGRAQLVKQETKMGWRQAPDAVDGFHDGEDQDAVVACPNVVMAEQSCRM
jgi:hypothetical protein